MSRPRLINLDLQHLRESREGPWFVVDLVMLLLLVVNLGLILADALYRPVAVQEFVAAHLGGLKGPLDSLATHFIAIDLAFVTVFLTEFFVRWVVAVRAQTYRRWFFYPFVHWYDLLGCIPLGAFRMLRFLRIFSILYRLHKYRIIDLRQTGVYRFLSFYYDVLMEELSDRVVVKVINGIQEDLREGSTVGQDILERLVKPRLDRLETSTRAVSLRASLAIQQDPAHPLARRLRESVVAAMQGNEELQRFAALPMIGSRLNQRLEDLVADVVVDTIACLIEQTPVLFRKEVWQQLGEVHDATWIALDRELLQLVDEILTLVKEQVSTQSWKRKLDGASMPRNP